MTYRQYLEKRFSEVYNLNVRIVKIGRYWYVQDFVTKDLIRPDKFRCETLMKLGEVI